MRAMNTIEDDTTSIEHLCSLNDQKHEKRQYLEALSAAKNLMDLYPEHSDGYWRSARALLSLRQPEEAIKIASDGLTKFPSDRLVAIVSIEACRAAGKYNQSVEYSKQLMASHPEVWNGYASAAQGLVALKKNDEAQAVIAVGLGQLPNHREILSVASDVYRAAEKRSQSLECARQLISIHPDDPIGYARAAQDLLVLKRHEEALQMVALGLEKFPNHRNLLATAADAYRVAGKREKALDCSRQLIDNHPGAWIGYVKAAQDLAALQRYEEAERMISLGLAKSPNHPRLMFAAANIYRLAGKREQSLSCARDLISRQPGNLEAYRIAMTNLIILGDRTGAEKLLKQALGTTPAPDPKDFAKYTRFLDQEKLSTQARQAIVATRAALHDFFRPDPSSRIPISNPGEFSDYILVSNNSTLQLGDDDLAAIAKMTRPVFVYLNSGNPVFCSLRSQFWHPGCSEILYGKTLHVAGPDGKLLFQPYSQESFLGCLFLIEGVQDWFNDFSAINHGASFSFVNQINDIIKDGYPRTHFFVRNRRKRRAPSMGWYALALFDAIASFFAGAAQSSRNQAPASSPRLWMAGFTLSPSYIFEVAKSELHDHVFERAALVERRMEQSIADIGNTSETAAEVGAKDIALGRRAWKG